MRREKGETRTRIGLRGDGRVCRLVASEDILQEVGHLRRRSCEEAIGRATRLRRRNIISETRL